MRKEFKIILSELFIICKGAFRILVGRCPACNSTQPYKTYCIVCYNHRSGLMEKTPVGARKVIWWHNFIREVADGATEHFKR